MTKIERIAECYEDEEFLTADGFNEAIIGVCADKVSGSVRVVYSRLKCILILISRDDK